MASFPDLRPGFRSAKAGGKAVRRFRSPVLLAVSAALLLTAFLAVSELATLRGAKAHDASAFLTRELGPPLDSAPLVRTPARDLKVSLSARGFAVRRGSQALGVTLKGKGAAEATGFARGASTRTSFGRAVVTVSPKKTEQYLVVDSHQGKRTWQWQLETDGLTPRVGDDGFVGLIAGHRLTETFVIAPPEILDSEGRNISPRGLHWDLTGRKGNWSLELTLDDNGMPTPYIIDPASYNVGAGTTGPTAAAGSIALNVPAGVKLGDLLIAHVAWGAGSTTTTSQPGGWTQILTTQNSGTNLGTSLWYKNASAADTSGGTYTWTFSPNDVATGGIAAYTGIDNSAPLQVTPTTLTQPATNDTGVYYPSITPTVNGDQIVSVLAWNRASSGTDLTAPAGINGTNTERWETANSGGIASELSDYTQGTAATVNTNGSNSANRKNVVHITFRVALKADTTAPNSAFALTSVSPAGSAYYPGSGTTVWYRGTDPSCAAEVQVAGRCSFKIQNTVTDAGSGPASSQFNALGGTTTGWLFTSGTVTMPAGGPYVSNFYSWASGTSSAPTENIVGADNGGNTDGGTTLTLMNDVTGPTVPAPTVTAGYYTSLSVPVSLGSVTDPGGSGPNASSYVVQRDEATLSNNVCGAFSDSWSTVTLSGGNDTTVVTGKCYRYREQAADNVRNSTNSSASNTAMVDTTAPSTPTLSFSNLSANAYWDTSSTVYFRPSAGGAFTVTALSNDAQSLIASYTFDTLNSNAGSNWGGSQTSDHFDYTFGASTTAPSTARTIHSTNNAGTNSADATYTIAADTTGPSVTAPSVTAGYYTSGSVPVGENGGTDGGSGVAPGSSMVQRDEATLSAGGCGSFSGSWTTVTLSAGNDTGVANGKCYEYREQLTDNVGNVGTSSASAIAKVDSAGPSNSFTLTSVSPAGSAFKNGTTIYYRGVESGGGSFKIRNALSDPESGAASSETAALGGTATGWTHTGSTVSTPAGGPFDSNDFTWAQGTMTSPTEVVTGRDGAGNATASATLTFTDDSSAPAGGALTVNGTAASGGGSTSYDSDGDFTIGTRTDYSETQSATESGLANSTLVRTSATYSSANVCGAFGSPTTISGNPDQTSLTTGCYRYTLTGTDNVGNTLSIQTTVKVDTSAPDSPSLSFSNVAGGAYYSGSGSQLFFRPTASSGGFDITAGSSDGDTDISGYTFPSAGSMGTNWSGSGSGASRTYSFTPTAGEPGTQNVSATNNAGGTSSSSFTVTADSAAATTTIQCNGAACLTGTYYTSSPVTVTLSGNDGTGSGVQKIRYTTDGTDPTPVNGSDYAGALSINSTTTVKFRAYDNLGNEEAVGSQEILLDGTPPNVSLTLAENPASGTQHVSGTTLFYRPGAAGGTFRVTAAADDPQTGVTSVDFPAISNVTGGGSQTSSPYREDYTWSASTTDAASHDVVATNGAGATTNVPFTLAADSAVPTGESITLTGADVPYYGSASVSFSLGDGNDGSGSGLDV
ncbi:MAG TPA: chitobiase/beta-hexosaminidase C-terminal domain-containing protein, partial [Gaiellaceae bacterium]